MAIELSLACNTAQGTCQFQIFTYPQQRTPTLPKAILPTMPRHKKPATRTVLVSRAMLLVETSLFRISATFCPLAGDALMLDVMLSPASAAVCDGRSAGADREDGRSFLHGVSPRAVGSWRSSRPRRQAACAAGDAGHTRQEDRHARRRSSPDRPALVACDVGTSSSPAPPFPCVPRCVPACVLRTAVQPPQRQGARPAPRHDRRQAQTTLLPAHGRQSGSASERPGLSARCRRRSPPMAGIFWNDTQHCLFLMFQVFQVFRPVFARVSLEHLLEHLMFQVFQRHAPVWRVGHQAPLPTPCSASART